MITFTVDRIVGNTYSGLFRIVGVDDDKQLFKYDGAYVEIMAMLRSARLLLSHFQKEYNVVIIPDIQDGSID